jgi:sec-independent protein translocase protein TatB
VFGIGGSEIIVILVVALLFLGPDKLPDAAKTISKGIRDIKKQSRALQQQIENDEQIGGAIRDLKSALRGEPEPPQRPPALKAPPKVIDESELDGTEQIVEKTEAALESPPAPTLTLPLAAGEPDIDAPNDAAEHDADLAKLIKPIPGAVAKGDDTKTVG